MNATIEPDARVAVDAVLGDGVYIGRGVNISSGVVIGARTKVWHYANILKNVRIGEDCMIGPWCQIDPDVIIGDRFRMQPHSIMSTSTIGDDVFVGAGTILTNAPYPPCKRFARTIIEDGVIIGSNVLFLPGLHIGKRAVIGSSAVVTKNVPPGIVVFGNPATMKFMREEYDRKQAEWEAGL